jgi:hypothetical protein
MIANWNRALREISSRSGYCKVLHSDDLMTPDCLERMVGLACTHPSVGIVSAYRLNGATVDLDAVVPLGTSVVPGREICRLALLGRGYVFGSPSSIMMRANLVRAHERFYNEENIHADVEACFELLQDCDLGFVHEVLTYTRRHAGSSTSVTSALSTHTTGWLRVLVAYGPVYLAQAEYTGRVAESVGRYCWFLLKSVVRGRFRNARFRDHHLETVRLLRASVSFGDLVRGSFGRRRSGRGEDR